MRLPPEGLGPRSTACCSWLPLGALTRARPPACGPLRRRTVFRGTRSVEEHLLRTLPVDLGRPDGSAAFHPEPVGELGYRCVRRSLAHRWDGRASGHRSGRVRPPGLSFARLKRGRRRGFGGWLVDSHHAGRVSKTCSGETGWHCCAHGALTAKSGRRAATILPSPHYRERPGRRIGATAHHSRRPSSPCRSRNRSMVACSHERRRRTHPLRATAPVRRS